jgi:Tfp pilus assembly protein PilO
MFKSLFSIIVIVASIIAVVTVASPRYQHAQTLKTQATELEEAFNKATQLRAVRTKLEEKFNSFTDADKTKLATMLPPYVDNVRLSAIDIQTLATQYNLILKDVTTSEPKITPLKPGEKANPVGIVNIEFSVTGEYTNFISFVEHIERSLRIIDIDSIAFSITQKKQDRPEDWYDYHVVMSTYWLRAE